nr:expressed protein [Echinococcus granulosus]
MRSPGQLTPMLLSGLPGKMQRGNSNVGSEKMQPRHISYYMPSKSKHNNFTRRGTVVRMNLSFAHDLASFVSMVDGKI